VAVGVTPVNVLTIDDSPRFLRVARELVAATPGFRCIGEAGSGEEGISAAVRLHPDLVLLDVRMPHMDGIETAQRLTEACPDLVILLLSAAEEADAPRAAHSCGAAAFIRKQDLTPGVLQAHWGRRA